MTPAVVRKNAHGGPQVRRNTRLSMRDGFTAYAAFSPEPNSFGLRRRRIDDRSKARSGPTISIGLTPATGARTTRLYFGIRWNTLKGAVIWWRWGRRKLPPMIRHRRGGRANEI